MSRHQYIRNLDYQDALDEYEGYSEEEDDELSPEDRELMTQGTAQVQAALGVEASKVTVAQIEEALWHYYYDVDKSVAYLISKYVNPAPKPKPAKTKPQEKNGNGKSATCALYIADNASSSDYDFPTDWATKTPTPLATPCFPSAVTLGSKPRPSLAHLFHDMPWGNVPRHRMATFIAPLMPRGGLLGGSGTAPKMSKLQALAAARKKKAQEQNASDNVVAGAVAGLKELSVDDSSGSKENVSLARPFGKRLKSSASTPSGTETPSLSSGSTTPGPNPSLGEVTGTFPSSTQHASSPGLSGPTLEETTPTQEEPPTTEPSSFGGILSGIRSLRQPPTTQTELKTSVRVEFDFDGPLYGVDGQGCPPPDDDWSSLSWFEVRRCKREDSDQYQDVVFLYPNLPQSARDAFAKPSPDDVVLAAQAKSSGFKGSLASKRPAR
jgi:elongation factor 1 alpha-like protein